LLDDGVHSTQSLYSQADLDRARAQSFAAAHEQSLEVSEHRLELQALEWEDVVRAKEWQIGNLTDLLEFNSDNERLAEHDERLKSRREVVGKQYVKFKIRKERIEKELSTASGSDDRSDAEKRLAVALVDFNSAEEESINIDKLLTAISDLIKKNERISDYEKAVAAGDCALVSMSLSLLPWMSALIFFI
jgi:hypothetical protein